MPSTAASRVLLRVFAQQLERVQRAVRRAADDVGEGAAAVDPELPARRGVWAHQWVPAGTQYRRRAAHITPALQQPREFAAENWPVLEHHRRSPPMNAPLPLPALDEIRAHEAEMVEIRHQIHANPELAYEEHATADLVAERLARWGYEVHRGLGGTGVVGTLRAGHFGPPHRPARRHGRAADRRNQRQALGEQGLRQDARLRPRRPHRDAAGRGAPPGGDAQFRRPPAPGVPAGRRRPGRRAQDAGGRLPRTVPVRGDVRHAQHAGHARGQVRRGAGFCDGQFATPPSSRCAASVGTARCRTWRSTRWWPRRASSWRCRPSSRATCRRCRWASSRSAPSWPAMRPTSSPAKPNCD